MHLRSAVRHLAAGDLDAARRGLDTLLRGAVGYDIAAISTVDPATMLWTSCYVSGIDEAGSRERERLLFDLEFCGEDLNGYAELATRRVPVATLREATGGDLAQAARWRLLLHGLGVTDELRAVLRSAGQCWGTLTLYRTGDAPAFTAQDVALVADAGTAMADVFRLTLLRAALDVPGGLEHPPGMLLVHPDGALGPVSETAERWLSLLDDRGRVPSVVQSVAAAVRAGNPMARAAVPSRAGQYVVLHGSPVSGTTVEDRLVAVIIESARPVVLSDAIVAAHGLTPRERDVTGLAALGRSTRQIANELDISPFTVGDHLKSAFSKVGVRSRSELVAALYHQHYRPRSEQGAQPGPYGWYLDHNVAV
ncbi:helix-turn-helix transcriptional regulator [Dactylosporangium aurantiacum]|uniref:Helix-turn-helix transcriptional regulator n=1 Tax=Dactylosporangium aurantiacum TaxID=35754 RepID=A0A9Q9IMZ9_9ACTN|nr:LuxR C-terminal-related transcriptional regulator [Dactylosporangium aurantiacum]MDG6108635.1 LuxR C-terminal-related transcriptional regulator [Dactylosporangium aurantiacum]UWZ59147.1 helix-turn-helix transcriptional regulator [Dactylosporangium aurantiacum]